MHGFTVFVLLVICLWFALWVFLRRQLGLPTTVREARLRQILPGLFIYV